MENKAIKIVCNKCGEAIERTDDFSMDYPRRVDKESAEEVFNLLLERKNRGEYTFEEMEALLLRMNTLGITVYHYFCDVNADTVV